MSSRPVLFLAAIGAALLASWYGTAALVAQPQRHHAPAPAPQYWGEEYEPVDDFADAEHADFGPVQIRGIRIEGRSSDEVALRREIRAVTPDLVHCRERATEAASGDVNVILTLGSDGRARGAFATGFDSAVAECIEHELEQHFLGWQRGPLELHLRIFVPGPG